MRWWVLRAAAVGLMALSLVLMLGAGRDGFLSCVGGEYSPVNHRMVAAWMHPNACSIDGVVPLQLLGLIGLVTGAAWLFRDLVRPR